MSNFIPFCVTIAITQWIYTRTIPRASNILSYHFMDLSLSRASVPVSKKEG